MRKQFFVCVAVIGLLTIIVASCWAVPDVNLDDEEDDVDEEIVTKWTEDYIKDDMIIDVMRNGLIAPIRKWPKAQVHYKISREFDTAQKANITAAMDAIEAVTCVRFLRASKTRKTYVNILGNAIGCNGAVGYQKRVQKLNLQKTLAKCFRVPVIQHELLHVLGFFHEHNAPVRDNFVKILWQNIAPGKKLWFQKLSNATVTDFGVGYDYDSITHYGPRAFGANKSETIVPLQRNAVIGQRAALSEKDIAKINAMYRCPPNQNVETTTVINSKENIIKLR